MKTVKNKLEIPAGEHCYHIQKIQDGEVLVGDITRFGKELREYSFGGGYKEVLCPYWQRTAYGTVKCIFLNKEVVDQEDDNAVKKIQQYFGNIDISKKISSSWGLADEIKICGIREDHDL